jgi:hypothetical protein
MENKAQLRDMKNGTQESMGLDYLEETIIKKVKGS